MHEDKMNEKHKKKQTLREIILRLKTFPSEYDGIKMIVTFFVMSVELEFDVGSTVP